MKTLRVLAAAVAVATSFGISSARAANYNVDSGFNLFGNVVNGGSFSDTYTFSLPGDSLLTGSLLGFAISGLSLSFFDASSNSTVPVTGDLNSFLPGQQFSQSISSGDRVIIAGNGNLSISSYGGYFNTAVTPVPEPGTLALLAGGLAMVAAGVRRRYRSE